MFFHGFLDFSLTTTLKGRMRSFLALLLIIWGTFSPSQSVAAINEWQLSLSSNKTLTLEYVDHGNGKVQLLSYQVRNHLGPEVLTSEDKTYIQELLSKEELSPGQNQLASFLVEMVPTNEPLGDYESPNNFSDVLIALSWVSICQNRGQIKTGTFSVDGQTYEAKAIVGDLDTSCKGRCGIGCGNRAGNGRYTQECLNHDICRRETGENWGKCNGEFWAAAAGFLAAETCPSL